MTYEMLLKRCAYCCKKAIEANCGTQEKAWFLNRAKMYSEKIKQMDKSIGHKTTSFGNYKTAM